MVAGSGEGAVYATDGDVAPTARLAPTRIYHRSVTESHAPAEAQGKCRSDDGHVSLSFTLKMRKLPPLNAVRAFEAAARHKSLSKAAEELSVTHGAVSRQVAVIEDWVGRPLFKRTPSQLILTDAGRTYQQELTPLFDRLSLCSLAARENARSEIRVKAPPTFTMRWLIPRMSGFQLRHPHVAIRLATSTAPADLQDGDCDVAIHSIRADHERTTCRTFMNDYYIPICHADLVAGGGNPIDLLRQRPRISYATWEDSWSAWHAATGEEAAERPDDLRFEQMFFALQAALEGLGTVILPVALVLDDLVQGRLIAPFGLRGARHRPWLACSAVSRAADPVVESFQAWIDLEGRDFECSASDWIDGAVGGDNPFRDSSQGGQII